MALVKCPALFDGTFNRFYTEYVEPNLPRPERVWAFDKFLSEYLSSENPAYIVRNVRDQERGLACTTVHGDQMIPSDNSPGWWIHSFLLGDEPMEDNAAGFFAQSPTHVFEVWRMETLNTAGYHLAHIFPVKNRDTEWVNWTRSDLQRRFILNIHPCNWFLLAKTDWQRNGKREDLIQWVKSAYRERYGEIYQSFLQRTGNDREAIADWRENPEYAFDSLRSRGGKSPGENRSTVKRHLDLKSNRNDHVKQSKRPIVCAELVGRDTVLDIKIRDRRFRLLHDELWRWVKANKNALNTKAWNDDGVYHWPKTPKDMLEFLSQFEVQINDD
jgi:hypothetical protein